MIEGDQQDRRKNLVLLAMYWYGKAAEVLEVKVSKGCHTLLLMALHLGQARMKEVRRYVFLGFIQLYWLSPFQCKCLTSS